MSYAFHGRPPEGDCKPPQAADFVALGFLAGLDHFAGRVDGAEHHGGLAELLDLIAKVRCNPRSFASAECGRNATRLNEAGSVLPRGAAMVAAASLRAFITGNDER